MAWALWRRHRWGFTAVLAGLLAVCALGPFVPEGGLIAFNMVSMGVALVAFFYVFTVFCYGLQMDVAGREWGFPSRMFTLPLRTGALVLWPMVYGTVSVVLLWLVLAWFVWRRQEAELPLAWPALLLATVVAWVQALVWSPFGWPLARVVALVLGVGALLMLTQLAAQAGVGEGPVSAVLAALVVAAYLVAHRGVARARRGDTPEWPSPARMITAVAAWLPRRHGPFASAGRAQLWWEWRRSRWAYPVFVACLLALAAPLLIVLEQYQSAVVETGNLAAFPGLSPPADAAVKRLGQMLLLPLYLSGVCGPGTTGSKRGSPLVSSPFVATRPLSCTELVAAK